MPLNKEALIRYRVINRCLVDYRYVSKARLMEACKDALDHEIGERTLEQDIHDMRYNRHLGFEAPIDYSKEYEGYYYTDSSFSIDKIPVNEDELEALSFAATLLNHYRNVEIFSTFSGAVQKIVDAVSIRRMLKDEAPYPFVEFETAPVVKGSEHLQALIRAIREKRVVSFDYKRFDAERSHRHVLHPFHLKEYRNRWYLIGLNHGLQAIRTYGLDRFQSAVSFESIAFTGFSFNPQDYYKATVGINAPQEEPSRVVLRFSRLQGQYIVTQPIHESQEIVEETESHLTVSLNLVPTHELIMLILGWGAEVEVVEPEFLRQDIQKIHHSSFLIYHSQDDIEK